MQTSCRPIATELSWRNVLWSAILAGSLVCSSSAAAITVTLAWDPSEMADRYALFSRLHGENYDYDHPAWVGTETTWTFSDSTDATTYFVVRAYNSEAESADSNEVEYHPVRVAVKCNGTTGSVKVIPGDTVTMTVSLDNKGRNDSTDFWLALKGPNGLLFYDGFAWTDIVQPFYQGPLPYVESLDILTVPTSDSTTGQYRVYFGVDTFMDGNLTVENLSYDFVDVELSQ